MSLATRLLLANPGAQVSSVLTGALTTPSSKKNSQNEGFHSISTVLVGSGGTATITFSSIPDTFQHLQVRFLKRNLRAGQAVDASNMRANGDSAAVYANHRLQGDGTTVSASGGSSLTSAIFGQAPSTTATASVFAGGIIDILDYANNQKYKVFRTITGYNTNGSGHVGQYSGLYQSTLPISSLSFHSNDGQGFAEYTHFALYGIGGV